MPSLIERLKASKDGKVFRRRCRVCGESIYWRLVKTQWRGRDAIALDSCRCRDSEQREVVRIDQGKAELLGMESPSSE